MEEEKKKIKDKFRSKCFNFVLYPEDESHCKALELIKEKYEYAYILHDSDENEATGEIKKEHWHIVLRFKNAKWNTALADELGITPNYIEETRTLKHSLLYLIHYYEPEKHQYTLDCVHGPLKKVLQGYIVNEGKTEGEKVLEIFEEIDTTDKMIDFRLFAKHVAKMGYWDTLRRSSSLILRYLDLHNGEYHL